MLSLIKNDGRFGSGWNLTCREFFRRCEDHICKREPRGTGFVIDETRQAVLKNYSIKFTELTLDSMSRSLMLWFLFFFSLSLFFFFFHLFFFSIAKRTTQTGVARYRDSKMLLLSFQNTKKKYSESIWNHVLPIALLGLEYFEKHFLYEKKWNGAGMFDYQFRIFFGQKKWCIIPEFFSSLN